MMEESVNTECTFTGRTGTGVGRYRKVGERKERKKV